MNDLNYLLVAGYGWSGSSAVVDLLKEFDNCFELGVEFRAVKDPYGLSDLEEKIVDDWDPLNSDIAIRDFIWHMEHLNHSSKRTSMTIGLSYYKYFGDNFLKQTYEFVNKITNFTYESEWWFPLFKKTKFEVFMMKLMKKLKLNKKNKNRLYFTNITEEQFIACTQEFIDSLFSNVTEKNKNIILDQAVPAQNYHRGIRYFRNAKLLIIDRDPRDIYADLKGGSYLIGKELQKTNDAQKYVDWHKALRRNMNDMQNDKNVKYITFEKLIFDYENMVKEIADFYELDISLHNRKKTLFIPEKSRKNIGIWKDKLTDSETSIIMEELKEYIC